ncbi:hypothetical protein GUJ93_ZPchr0008g12931 [Zizania palustris]|uniref:Uncharacterized protein n=1 Tax=Zizania palustris TaxID=103762 RepID=A0A8J5UWT7_ZIZPA|nr:hypothetical protein GUJ93_ZPchr0008g12931 [Zizania palustris]
MEKSIPKEHYPYSQKKKVEDQTQSQKWPYAGPQRVVRFGVPRHASMASQSSRDHRTDRTALAPTGKPEANPLLPQTPRFAATAPPLSASPPALAAINQPKIGPPAMDGGERRGGCFSCCFGGGDDGEAELGQRAARALRTSSRWVRERAVELPELVARARAGRRRRKHPQQLAGEFRYDPISYALNFEDEGAAGECAGEAEPFKYRAFSARLPASPPPPPPMVTVAVNRGS